jgi:hypothetical protein
MLHAWVTARYIRLRFPVPKFSITCSLFSPMWPCRLRSSKSSSVTSPFRFGGKHRVLNTRTGDEGSVGTVTMASYQLCEGWSTYIKHFPIMLTQLPPSQELFQSNRNTTYRTMWPNCKSSRITWIIWKMRFAEPRFHLIELVHATSASSGIFPKFDDFLFLLVFCIASSSAVHSFWLLESSREG